MLYELRATIDKLINKLDKPQPFISQPFPSLPYPTLSTDEWRQEMELRRIKETYPAYIFTYTFSDDPRNKWCLGTAGTNSDS